MNTTHRTSIAALAAFSLGAGSALAQTTMDAEAAGPGGSADSWNLDANWDGGTGSVPTGTIDVIIANGIYADTDSATTPTYTGTLTLQDNATLALGDGNSGNNPGDINPLISATSVTLNTGSAIRMRAGYTVSFPPLVVDGPSEINTSPSNAGHGKTRNFGALSGSSTLTIKGNNNMQLNFGTDNSATFPGNLVFDAIDRHRVNANSVGAFGNGTLTINPRTDGRSAQLEVEALNALASLTTVNLNGKGYNNNSDDRLTMNQDSTVNQMLLDGFALQPGTYTSADWFITGGGTLTVNSAPADSTAPTVLSIVDNEFGGPVWTDAAPFLFTLTFDEDIDETTIDAADFENGGTSGALTIGTITKTSLEPLAAVITVEVTPASTGTLQLNIAASATIEDQAGNLLNTGGSPIPGDTTIDVNAGATPATTITGTTTGPANGDTWMVIGNWDNGIPNGTQSAILDADAKSSVANTAAYSGGLTMQAGRTLLIGGIGSSQNVIGCENALGTGPLTMNTNSVIDWRLKLSGYTFPSLVMAGDAKISADSTEAHSKSWNIEAVSGTGTLTIAGTNNNDGWRFKTDNSATWSGGLVITQNNSNRTVVEADVSGALGTGNITSEPGTALQIDAVDAMGDGAVLTMNGKKTDKRAAKLVMNQSDTVDQLWIDGVQQAAGDYTSASGLQDIDGNNLISGGGTLTVLSGPAAGSPYDTWATGGELFDDDENGDGVANGVAFLLGAADPNADATGLLPTVSEDGSGGLVLTFSMLNAANRGAASLSTQHSADLGDTDAWDAAGNEEVVPETTSTVGVVDFVVTPNGSLNDVVATIPVGEANGGDKLFGRVSADEGP